MSAAEFDPHEIARQVREGRDYEPDVAEAVAAALGKGRNDARAIADRIHEQR